MISVQTQKQAQVWCGPMSENTPRGDADEVLPRAAGRNASSGGASEEESRGEGTVGGGGDSETLEDAARGEREYVRGRLREELGREPSEEEMDEWLREHTEGY